MESVLNSCIVFSVSSKGVSFLYMHVINIKMTVRLWLWSVWPGYLLTLRFPLHCIHYSTSLDTLFIQCSLCIFLYKKLLRLFQQSAKLSSKKKMATLKNPKYQRAKLFCTLVGGQVRGRKPRVDNEKQKDSRTCNQRFNKS